MATYDLTTMSPTIEALESGDILNCPYSGTYKSIILPRGVYKLECWGAQGGDHANNTALPGKGGYSVGILTLFNNTTLYLYSGGMGGNSTASCGGYNGGGVSRGTKTNLTNVTGGGGGSDIRVGSTSLYARVIVAGGGGGSGNGTGAGGEGGGLSGVGGKGTATEKGVPGTQTSAGVYPINDHDAAGFGLGGGGPNGKTGGGGGGGWYGGSFGLRAQGGGAGGSGYVYTSSSYTSYPPGSLLNSSYYLTSAQTIAGDSSFIDYSGSSVIGHSGNGAIRITIMKLPKIKKFI